MPEELNGPVSYIRSVRTLNQSTVPDHPVSPLTEITYMDSPYSHAKTERMCEAMIPSATSHARILLLAGLVLFCIAPVSATDRIAIDPVPGNLTTGAVIGFTGTTTLPAGTTLQYEFSRKEAGTESVRYGEYSGTEGTITVVQGTAGQIWKVPILTQGYAPADYIFRIGKDRSENRVSVQVRLAARGEETPVPIPVTTAKLPCGEFKSPVYVSPGWTNAVGTIPDLNTRCSILAKGAPLAITATTSNIVGIWITSASSVTGYTHFQRVSSDGSGSAEYDLTNTTALRSGQYFIYVVDGGKTLNVLPGEKDPSAHLTADALEAKLKVYEKQNPYQKFTILLEEPVITMNDIPDAVSGIPVEINGTTNLNTGALLDISVFLADVDPQKQQPAFAVAGIPVTEGTKGHGSWHAVLNTSSLPTGEYIVKAHNGSTEATGLVVLYDSLYDVGVSSGEGLITKTYAVDPETKTVVTDTPARGSGLPVDPGILVIACLAGVVCLYVIVNTLRKK